MWIDDVVPYNTIESGWGNAVRDRVVQTFATQAERDAHLASLPEGALCQQQDTKVLYVKRSGAWRYLQPTIKTGSCFGMVVPAGTPATVGSMAVPPGFSTGIFYFTARSIQQIVGPGGWSRLVVSFQKAGTTVWSTQQDVPNYADNRDTISVHIAAPVNGAGETWSVVADLEQAGLGTRRFYENDGSMSFTAVLLY